jgi:hypothetical protein
VFVGVGVGGMLGQDNIALHSVPFNGAVTTSVTTDGEAEVFVKLAVPKPPPDTFG